MADNSQYFENKECKYYPCHEGISECNCMFCYCPFYSWEKCPGNNHYKISKSGKRVKVCTDCTFPHRKDNYDEVIEILRIGEEEYSNRLLECDGAYDICDKKANSSNAEDENAITTFYGVGVGPGEPSLITKQAADVIKCADVLILPAKDKDSCRAYTIALQAIPVVAHKECVFAPFPMSMKEPELSDFHREVADKVEGYIDAGKCVALLTIGDVSIYSTFVYVERLVKQDGYNTAYICGVPSFVAAASRLGVPLTIGSEEMHIIPGSADVTKALELNGTLVFMKSGKKLVELIGLLKEYSQSEEISVAAVSNCGMPNEVIAHSIDSINTDSGYLTVVIVKKLEYTVSE